MSHTHEVPVIEFPILVAISAEPVSGMTVVFIGETHGNAIAVEGPLPPIQKFERFRYRESNVYASATLSGGREFQASSARHTFCIEVLRVNGGNGGRVETASSGVFRSVTAMSLFFLLYRFFFAAEATRYTHQVHRSLIAKLPQSCTLREIGQIPPPLRADFAGANKSQLPARVPGCRVARVR